MNTRQMRELERQHEVVTYTTIQQLINRLIKRGLFDLNSDAEFSALSRADQDSVRRVVRFNLLQEA
jgi:predicted transcriptional regulator